MLKHRLHTVMVTVLLSASLSACGGGGNGGNNGGNNGGTTPPLDNQADTFELAPASFDDVLPGESIEASAKISGFNESLTATFTTKGPVSATVRNGRSGKKAKSVDFKTGDTLFALVTVKDDAAAGDDFSLELVVGSGNTAVSASLKGTVGDNADPVVTVYFPPDRSVTLADKISVTGSAADNAGINSIVVNGEPANFDPDTGLWGIAASPLALIGGNDLVVEAKDVNGRITKQVLDIFRRDPADPATYVRAFDEGYLGNGLVDVTATPQLAVDAVTSLVYVGMGDRDHYLLLEINPDTSTVRTVFADPTLTSGSAILRNDHPLVVHDGMAYFYTLDGVDDTGAYNDAFDGIWRADLAQCPDVADAACITPFVVNTETHVADDDRIFYDDPASLRINKTENGDELWVFNVGESAALNNGVWLRVSLASGELLGSPMAVGGASQLTSMIGGTLYAAEQLTGIQSFDLSTPTPDTTIRTISRCGDGSGSLAPSLDCGPDGDNIAGTIGDGPRQRQFFALATRKDETLLFSLMSVQTVIEGVNTVTRGLYAIDLASGDRDFLVGVQPTDNVANWAGETVHDFSLATMIGDPARNRLYIWNGSALFAVNPETVKDAGGTRRIAADSVLVVQEVAP